MQIGAKHRVSSGVQLEAFAAAVRANFPSKSLFSYSRAVLKLMLKLRR